MTSKTRMTHSSRSRIKHLNSSPYPHLPEPSWSTSYQPVRRYNVAPHTKFNLQTLVRLMPEWFPGASFKRIAKEWRKTLYEMVEGPYQLVRKQTVCCHVLRYTSSDPGDNLKELGVAEPSMLSNLLQDKSDVSDEEMFDMKWASASMYAGGADTVCLFSR